MSFFIWSLKLLCISVEYNYWWIDVFVSHIRIMHLKITSLWWTIFDGEISKATVPTYDGEITILNGHQPLSSVVKAGILSFVPAWEYTDGELIDGKAHISVSKWLVLIDGKQIVVTTSAATSSVEESTEVLETMRKDMEEKLAQIKEDGNASDLEIAIENMEKIQADIKLSKIGKIS